MSTGSTQLNIGHPTYFFKFHLLPTRLKQYSSAITETHTAGPSCLQQQSGNRFSIKIIEIKQSTLHNITYAHVLQVFTYIHSIPNHTFYGSPFPPLKNNSTKKKTSIHIHTYNFELLLSKSRVINSRFWVSSSNQ